MHAIAQRYPDRRLWLVGFSLGGNFLLRVAALPDAAALNLAGVIAISPVLDPARTLAALEAACRSTAAISSGSGPDHWSASRRCGRSIMIFAESLRTRDLRHMTAELVGRYTDFPHIDDYLEGYAITGKRLATLAAPAVLLTASDDPIIPVQDLQRLAHGPKLRVHVTAHGGHTGFLERLGEPSWANRFVLATMARNS